MTTGERNIQIVNKLLEGATTMEMAYEYKLSPASIRAIRSKAKTSTGLGDAIDSITESTGIKRLVKFVAGEDCGCDERKEKLNDLFPNVREPKCMTEQMYKEFELIRDNKVLTGEQRKEVAVQHAYLFSHKFAMPCSCSPARWIAWVSDIEKVYQSYQ